ncbi:MAG: hypothetical protein WEB57_00020 [Pseudohongiellaceae bacterium]
MSALRRSQSVYRYGELEKESNVQKMHVGRKYGAAVVAYLATTVADNKACQVERYSLIEHRQALISTDSTTSQDHSEANQ